MTKLSDSSSQSRSVKITKWILEFLRGFLIIMGFLFLGKLISAYLPVPFPASIIGLILLFIALSTPLVKAEWITLSGDFILRYMALLFIPIGAGLVNYLDLLLTHWLAIVCSLLFTTLFIMLLVGHFFQFLDKKKES
ncbi:CidA/LrgA family protein [Psychromonas sp. PT13]|uniref:CidA/LrgA family protein n=1 Tax=Psychromonas sp. PT13 TaxID=3439547 RepID=UPI003EBBAFE5